MAQQIAGLCFLEGTFDQLTFYKMEGKYYVRVKSSLTSQRVKTAPEFRWTMALARLMGRASKIGSAIYQALPPNWRQFWMYRSFTGEAYTMLLHSSLTDEEVKQTLWKTYVEYWEQWEAANTGNPALPIIKAPKQQKIRKRRVYSLESLLRQKDKYGKPKWRNPEEEERKRQRKALNDAAWQRTLEKEKLLAAEQVQPILTNEEVAKDIQDTVDIFDPEACTAVQEVQQMLDALTNTFMLQNSLMGIKKTKHCCFVYGILSRKTLIIKYCYVLYREVVKRFIFRLIATPLYLSLTGRRKFS